MSLMSNHRWICCLVLSLFGAIQYSHAATITVDIGFQSVGGTCRLDDAIVAANTDGTVDGSGCVSGSGDDIIVIDLPENIDQIRLNDTLRITSEIKIIPANDRFIRIIMIDPGGAIDLTIFEVLGSELNPLTDVEFSSLGFSGGAQFSESDMGGGALDIQYATVSMNTVELKQNTGLLGGAIRIRDGDLSIRDCRFDNNSSSREGFPFGRGGAINSEDSTLHIDNCVFFANLSNWRAGAINGTNSEITIENSTFETNIASFPIEPIIDHDGDGGAIYIDEDSQLLIKNSTFSNNRSIIQLGSQERGNGGAISAHNSSVDLQHVSMIGNRANYSGGAIYMAVEADQAAELNVTASIISNNVANAMGGGREIFFSSASENGNASSGGSNIFGHAGTTTAFALDGFSPALDDATATSDGNLPTSTSDLFNSLGDNGTQRPTPFSNPKTHALPEGSPAIDSASRSTCFSEDQLGAARNLNKCDVGAYESPFGEPESNFYHILVPNKGAVVFDL